MLIFRVRLSLSCSATASNPNRARHASSSVRPRPPPHRARARAAADSDSRHGAEPASPTRRSRADENLSRERVRQIVAQSLEEPEGGTRLDHARVQIARLEPALRLAARGVADGELRAIDRLLRVLDRLDKYGAVAEAPAALRGESARAAADQAQPDGRAHEARRGRSRTPAKSHSPDDAEDEADGRGKFGKRRFRFGAPCKPLISPDSPKRIFGNVWRKRAGIWKCLAKTLEARDRRGELAVAVIASGREAFQAEPTPRLAAWTASLSRAMTAFITGPCAPFPNRPPRPKS